jgi:hypothetical protein
MPNEILAMNSSSLKPKEYLNRIGLASSEFNTILIGSMPWKKLYMFYKLNAMHLAKVATAINLAKRVQEVVTYCLLVRKERNL